MQFLSARRETEPVVCIRPRTGHRIAVRRLVNPICYFAFAYCDGLAEEEDDAEGCGLSSSVGRSTSLMVRSLLLLLCPTMRMLKRVSDTQIALCVCVCLFVGVAAGMVAAR